MGQKWRERVNLRCVYPRQISAWSVYCSVPRDCYYSLTTLHRSGPNLACDSKPMVYSVAKFHISHRVALVGEKPLFWPHFQIQHSMVAPPGGAQKSWMGLHNTNLPHPSLWKPFLNSNDLMAIPLAQSLPLKTWWRKNRNAKKRRTFSPSAACKVWATLYTCGGDTGGLYHFDLMRSFAATVRWKF